MALNVLDVDKLLKDTYECELARHVTDYQKAHESILEKRSDEFRRKKSGIGLPWKKETINEENYPYKNILETNQIYTVPGKYGIGGVRITIEQIPLPVTENTEAKKAEVSFPAAIPCGCWNAARFYLAKDCDVIIRPLQYFGGCNYYDAFCKDVKDISKLLSGVEDVSKAVFRLKAGLKTDTKQKFELTKI